MQGVRRCHATCRWGPWRWGPWHADQGAAAGHAGRECEPMPGGNASQCRAGMRDIQYHPEHCKVSRVFFLESPTTRCPARCCARTRSPASSTPSPCQATRPVADRCSLHQAPSCSGPRRILPEALAQLSASARNTVLRLEKVKGGGPTTRVSASVPPSPHRRTPPRRGSAVHRDPPGAQPTLASPLHEGTPVHEGRSRSQVRCSPLDAPQPGGIGGQLAARHRTRPPDAEEALAAPGSAIALTCAHQSAPRLRYATPNAGPPMAPTVHPRPYPSVLTPACLRPRVQAGGGRTRLQQLGPP
jgi:hypothetical protein